MLNRMLDVLVLTKQHAQINERFTMLEAMAPDMPLALLVAPTKHHYLSLCQGCATSRTQHPFDWNATLLGA